MRTLVIDCATEACSVALFDGDALLSGECRTLGRGHAEALIPMIAALPGNGRAARIAVALGPGSFTGVRVGLAAAKALAFAWQASLVGYPTLSLIAAQALAHLPDEVFQGVCVAITGGHGEWFVQEFAADGAPLGDLASLAPTAAAAVARADLVSGNQAAAVVALRGHGTAMPALPDARRFTSLPATALLDDIEPLYGRAPDAKLPAGVL